MDARELQRRASAARLREELRNITERMARLREDWDGRHMPRGERQRLSELDVRRADVEQRILDTIDRPQLSEPAFELIEIALECPGELESWCSAGPSRSASLAQIATLLYKWAIAQKQGNSNRWATFSISDYELADIDIDAPRLVGAQSRLSARTFK
jgi:hypothetical protein